jgi:hypothetical protein
MGKLRPQGFWYYFPVIMMPSLESGLAITQQRRDIAIAIEN